MCSTGNDPKLRASVAGDAAARCEGEVPVDVDGGSTVVAGGLAGQVSSEVEGAVMQLATCPPEFHAAAAVDVVVASPATVSSEQEAAEGGVAADGCGRRGGGRREGLVRGGCSVM